MEVQTSVSLSITKVISQSCIENEQFNHVLCRTELYRKRYTSLEHYLYSLSRDIMFDNATPEKAIAFVELSVIPSCCWPLPETASNFRIVCFKTFRILAILNAICLAASLMYAAYVYHNDFVICTHIMCLVPSMLKITAETIFFIVEYDHFRYLIEEMINYCKAAKAYERDVFQQYIDKYCKFYGWCSIWFYSTATILIFGTLLLPNPFPTLAEYPFPVDQEPTKTLIFLHQSIAVYQIAAHICVGILGVLLLLFSGARFEILTLELSNAENYSTIMNCLRKYYTIRKYAKDVVAVVRYVVLFAMIVCSTSVVLCGIQIIEDGPFVPKVQFTFMGATALLQVFMHAWPADNLLHTSANVFEGLYRTTWYNQSLRVQKIVLMSLIPQQPVNINIKCVLPALSLNYYCTYVSNVLSFFTFLRTITDEEET